MAEQIDKGLGDEQQQVRAIAYTDPWQYDVSHWQQLLEWPDLDYEGDTQRGVELLMQISQGMKDVHDDPDLPYPSPRLAIAYGQGYQPTMKLDPLSNAAVVGVDFLSTLSQLDAKNPVALKRDDGAVIFRGKVDDFAYFRGLEEAHHARTMGAAVTEYADALTMTLDEYEGRDEEFSALVYMQKKAKEKGMPDATLQFLAERVSQVIQYMTNQVKGNHI